MTRRYKMTHCHRRYKMTHCHKMTRRHKMFYRLHNDSFLQDDPTNTKLRPDS